MTERIDLAAALKGYQGDPPPPRPAPSPIFGEQPPDGQLGDPGHVRTAQNLVITGPPGPPPAWVLTDPPHPGQLRGVAEMQLSDLGAPPPTLQFDADGVYFIHPETGDRVDVVMNCQGCGASHPGSLTCHAGADRRWLCENCRGADG